MTLRYYRRIGVSIATTFTLIHALLWQKLKRTDQNKVLHMPDNVVAPPAFLHSTHIYYEVRYFSNP